MSGPVAYSKRLVVWFHIFGLTFLLVMSGCSFMQKQPDTVKMTGTKHPNGLVVGVPEKFVARQTETGYTIQPEGDANSKARYPVEISVSLVKAQNVPQESSLKTRRVGQREIHYRVEKGAGGSGGEQYFFTAYEAVPNGYILYSQAKQSESGEPDFDLCWSVIKATRYESV